MKSYMFGTDIFVTAIEKHAGELIKAAAGMKYYATREQYEMLAGKDAGLRKLFGIIPDGAGAAGAAGTAHESPTISLLDGRKALPGNAQNAAVIDACVSNGYTFVTEDVFLADIAWKYGAPVNNLHEFLKAAEAARAAAARAALRPDLK